MSYVLSVLKFKKSQQIISWFNMFEISYAIFSSISIQSIEYPNSNAVAIRAPLPIPISRISVPFEYSEILFNISHQFLNVCVLTFDCKWDGWGG